RDAGYEVGVTAADASMLPSYDFVLGDGEVIKVGRLRLHTIATPGHTPGSMCFRLQGSPVHSLLAASRLDFAKRLSMLKAARSIKWGWQSSSTTMRPRGTGRAVTNRTRGTRFVPRESWHDLQRE